MVAEHRDGT